MSDSKLPKSRSDHLLQQFEGIRSLVKHLGLSDTNIPAKFGEVEQQFKSFNRMLADRDLFAKTFSPLGWVYYDNISSRLVADVVQMDLDEGEAALVRYHLDPSTLRLLKNRFQSRHYEAWAEHYDRAVERAGTEDYLSAVLLTIIIIDGMWITSTGKHPFSPGVNTPVFDSETCGPGGLTERLALLGSMRRKLDMEPITVPFRHGIVHGLNPNFGNPLVAAKSFNLLQASVDYFDSRRDEAERVAKAAEEQRPVSWGELGRNLVRNAEEKRAIETWHARPPIRDMILAASDEPLKLAIDSPEAAAAQYLKLLMARNFGGLAKATVDYPQRPIGYRAGRLRTDLGSLSLTRWTISGVEDVAPAISCISIQLDGQLDGVVWHGTQLMRLIFSDLDYELLVRGEPGGSWFVMPNFLGGIWLLAMRARRGRD